MRVISGYRTISMEAAAVIAGMTPICNKLEEDVACYEMKLQGIATVEEARKQAGRLSAEKWQREWDKTENGRWTHRLIPDISKWINRKHGEVNFHLTQFLSGHGSFRKYLHKFGKADSPLSCACHKIEETAEHIFFVCPKFEEKRRRWMAACGKQMTVESIIDEMYTDVDCWNETDKLVREILEEVQRQGT